MKRNRKSRGTEKRRPRHGGGTNRVSGEEKLALEAAAPWPVVECYISSWWRDPTKLTEILIAKKPPFGGVVTIMFLIDPGCLGIKQAFVSQFHNRNEYEEKFREMILTRRPMISSNFSLAAKIIRETMCYASELGFEPSIDVQKTLRALGSLDVAAECTEEISLGGVDGKPFYMAGPDDDVEHILNTLNRSCGKGNFNFTVMESQIPPEFFD